MRRRTFFRIVMLAAGLSVALSVGLYAAHLDPSDIALRLSESHLWMAPFIYMGIEFIATLIPPVPNAVSALLGGYLFGAFAGTLYTLLAGMAGSVILFKLARSGKEAFAQRFLKKEKDIRRVNSFLAREHGFYSLVFIRFSPLFPNDVFTLLLGFTDITFRRFFATTLLGYAVSYVTLAYVGSLFASLGSDISQAETLPAVLFLTMLSAVGLLVAFWQPLMRRLRRKI